MSIPSNMNRLISWIQHNKILLSNVSKLTIETKQIGAGEAGSRFFVREYLPCLKYHNPNVDFSRTNIWGKSDEMSKLRVEITGLEQEKHILTNNLMSNEILDKLLDLDKNCLNTTETETKNNVS